MERDVLFRLRGTPIYRGSLVLYQADPDNFPNPRPPPQPCIVLDFAWCEDSKMHLAHVLLDGEVLVVYRSDLTPV